MADQSILIVVDPGAKGGRPALERAAWLAERSGTALELYICDYDAAVDTEDVSTAWLPQPLREEQTELHRQTLESLAAPLRERGLTVTTGVEWSHPRGEAIVRKAAAARPWLVAKDTHHHNLLKRTLFSSTDWHLIRGCPAPLLLAKERTPSATPKVIASVDPFHERDRPAELDDKIFRFAAMLAQTVGGELHVFHAFGVPVAMDIPVDAARAIEQQHREVMSAFCATHEVPAERTHVLEGSPEQRLPELVETLDASFVVMGAVSRRWLDRLLIGSTAERVLDRLPCDLLVIKPDVFETSLPHSG
jgi:universal stress protein E